MFVSSLLLLAAAVQQPIYLKCVFPGNGAVLDVTADEANSSILTILESSGHVEKYNAAFTPSEVRFSSRDLSYVLSRTDLGISREIRMISSVDRGTCSLQQAPKRAF